MDWYNKPPIWDIHDDTMTVQAGPKTDFWRPSDGALRDNGHFYYHRQQGDFLAEVKISGCYSAIYDQAGLMVRVDPATWIKCGVEFVNGVQHASAVVTHEYSDWSVAPLPENPPALWLRLRRQAATIEVHYSLDGERYQLLRQTYFSPAEAMRVGLMCASPEGTGFSVTFEGLTIQNL